MLIEQNRDVDSMARDKVVAALRRGSLTLERARHCAILGDEHCAALFKLTQEEIDPTVADTMYRPLMIHPRDRAYYEAQQQNLKIAKALNVLTDEEVHEWADILLSRVLRRIKCKPMLEALISVRDAVHADENPNANIPVEDLIMYAFQYLYSRSGALTCLQRSACFLLTIRARCEWLFEAPSQMMSVPSEIEEIFQTPSRKRLLIAAIVNSTAYSAKERKLVQQDAIRILRGNG